MNTCNVCHQPGFPPAVMSLTEAGLTCPLCFSTWQDQQQKRAHSLAQQTAQPPKIFFYLLLALTSGIVGLALLGPLAMGMSHGRGDSAPGGLLAITLLVWIVFGFSLLQLLRAWRR